VDRAIHSATSRLKIGIPKIISIRLNGSIEQPPAAARAHKRIADQSRWIAARHVRGKDVGKGDPALRILT
jgi:hypothetical protein